MLAILFGEVLYKRIDQIFIRDNRPENITIARFIKGKNDENPNLYNYVAVHLYAPIKG
ncbi:hypothetical protein ACJX0J_013542, partial [Zea mays]